MDEEGDGDGDDEELEEEVVNEVHSQDCQDGDGQEGGGVECYVEWVLADDHVDGGLLLLGGRVGG